MGDYPQTGAGFYAGYIKSLLGIVYDCGKGFPVSHGPASGVWISGSSLCYANIASLMIKPIKY
jgi:hypothetical protein